MTKKDEKELDRFVELFQDDPDFEENVIDYCTSGKVNGHEAHFETQDDEFSNNGTITDQLLFVDGKALDGYDNFLDFIIDYIPEKDILHVLKDIENNGYDAKPYKESK